MSFDTPAGTRGGRQPRAGLLLRLINKNAATRFRRTGKIPAQDRPRAAGYPPGTPTRLGRCRSRRHGFCLRVKTPESHRACRPAVQRASPAACGAEPARGVVST